MFIAVSFYILLDLATWRANVYLDNFIFHIFLSHFWVLVCEIYIFRCTKLFIVARYW